MGSLWRVKHVAQALWDAPPTAGGSNNVGNAFGVRRSKTRTHTYRTHVCIDSNRDRSSGRAAVAKHGTCMVLWCSELKALSTLQRNHRTHTSAKPHGELHQIHPPNAQKNTQPNQARTANGDGMKLAVKPARTVAELASGRPEREFPISVWYALKNNSPQKFALARENKKTPKKHKNTPQKRKNTPQKHKNTPKRRKKHPKYFALTREKKLPSSKIIVFAGTPRRPATPGIPALRPPAPGTRVHLCHVAKTDDVERVSKMASPTRSAFISKL